MNLKTKLALAEDISWAEASEEADLDVEIFNYYYDHDWDSDYPDNESGFDEDDLEFYSKYDSVDDL